MGKLDEVAEAINQLSNEYGELDSYEAEHVLIQKGFPKAVAKRAAQAYTPAGSMHTMRNNVTPASVAQFDLNINRADTAGEGGNKIEDTLPFVIFGQSQKASGYKSIIAEAIPAGITLVVTGGFGSATPDKIVFTYTRTSDGAISTLTVSCPQTAYTSLLDATTTDMLVMKKVRYRINNLGTNNANTAQFTTEFKGIIKSLFGSENRNDVPLAAAENPGDFKSNIIDVNQNLEVDKDTAYRLGMIYVSGGGFQVTLSSFVEHFRKYNAKGVFPRG